VPLTRVAQAQHHPLRTLRAWVSRYHRQGLAGLARQPRADHGHRRRVTPELEQLIAGLALKRPAPTAAQIQRQLTRVAPEHGWAVPSYRTVAAIVAQLEPALVTLAHDGSVAYRESFDLLYRREASAANDVWQADHTPLDIWVRDGDGKPVRPWFTVILDDDSRAVAAYRVSVQAPSALQTALTLREAIWRKSDPHWQICGIPGTFYTDHGSDFTSQHLEQVAADLRMVLVFSEAGKPRGRGRIERFFRTVNELCLSTLGGYTPRGSAKPAAPPLLLSELEARLRAFLLDDYNHRVHGETGMTPHARWEAAGFLPNLPESLEHLDLLLLTVAKPRTVQQDGIHFEGLRYLDITLAAYVGEAVVIRYDPKDLSEIRVFYQNRFLCRAVCQEVADRVISLKEIVQARTQRRRQLGDTLRQRATLVDTVLAASSPTAVPAPELTPTRPRLKRYLND
jgi:putative transposase